MASTKSKSLSTGLDFLNPTVARPSGVTGRVNWQLVAPIALMHLAMPLAFLPQFFSWTGVVLVFLGNYIFCGLGVGLCYHRALTHQGLKMPKWLEHTFAVLGFLTLQNTPLAWVTVHRLHHRKSDTQEDPHTPLAGFFWGHMGWIFHTNTELSPETVMKVCPDLIRDRFYKKLERKGLIIKLFALQVALFFVLGFLVELGLGGTAVEAMWFGGSFVVWGVIIRTIYSWHVTWGVNSVAHKWGYRNYETNEHSRNNWIIGLATNGEGWHNNHHADQRSAAHGHKWWELDLTFLTIRFLEKIGLAEKVVLPKNS